MPLNLRGPEFLVLLLLVAVLAGVLLLVVWAVKAASRPSSGPVATNDAPRPAGWYPVPDGSGRVAWWDGDKWADPQPPPGTPGAST